MNCQEHSNESMVHCPSCLAEYWEMVAAEYRRDALRYRWLKENIRGGSIGTPIGWFDDDVSDWDEDIDKAMEQTK